MNVTSVISIFKREDDNKKEGGETITTFPHNTLCGP